MSTVRVLLCMLGLCLQSCSSQAEEPPVVSEAMNIYYTRQSRISNVMNDSAYLIFATWRGAEVLKQLSENAVFLNVKQGRVPFVAGHVQLAVRDDPQEFGLHGAIVLLLTACSCKRRQVLERILKKAFS